MQMSKHMFSFEDKFKIIEESPVFHYPQHNDRQQVQYPVAVFSSEDQKSLANDTAGA